jgi:putative NADH-flavin reductase
LARETASDGPTENATTMKAQRLFLLGASGGTGQHMVSQALQQGRDVTAFVRNPGKLTARHDRLVVIGWSSGDGAEQVADQMRGHDAVISTLGVAAFKSGGLIERSARVIVPAMERAGVCRLVFTSAFGVVASHRLPFVPRTMQRLLLGEVYADKAAGEALIRSSALDWTLVYPSMLTTGPRTGRYRVGEHLELRGLPRLSRADLADFLLTQADDAANVRKGVLVSY